MQETQDRSLKREEVLRLLGISTSTFYRLVNSGALRAHKITTALRVKASEVERFRREREV